MDSETLLHVFLTPLDKETLCLEKDAEVASCSRVF